MMKYFYDFSKNKRNIELYWTGNRLYRMCYALLSIANCVTSEKS